jgi:Na+(H+)/acetate symporter ActP
MPYRLIIFPAASGCVRHGPVALIRASALVITLCVATGVHLRARSELTNKATNKAIDTRQTSGSLSRGTRLASAAVIVELAEESPAAHERFKGGSQCFTIADRF